MRKCEGVPLFCPKFRAPKWSFGFRFKQGSESLRATPGLSRRGSNRNLSHSTHILSPVADCTIGPLDQTGHLKPRARSERGN